MDSALNFLTAAALERFIVEKQSNNLELRRVLLSASGINDIDASGIDVLESLMSTLQSQGVEIYLSAVKRQVWEVLDRAGLITLLGSNRFFSTDREAVNDLCKKNGVIIAT